MHASDPNISPLGLPLTKGGRKFASRRLQWQTRNIDTWVVKWRDCTLDSLLYILFLDD
jgi:hypothetical protein